MIDRDGEATWQEIADEVGLSRKGAKYVYNSAMKKLKQNPELKKYWIDLIGEEHAEVEDIQDVLAAADEEDEEDEELDLEPLHHFMSDYIGMIVVGIKGFSDDTILEDAEKVHCKIISGCTLKEGSIVFELSNVSGGNAGYLKLSPSRHGSFAEREPGDIPMYSSRYRIFFYGGDALEYLDTEKDGSIEYLGG